MDVIADNWPILIAGLGVFATAVGLVSNVFGIASNVRDWIKGPIPREFAPGPQEKGGAGGNGMAKSIATGVVAGGTAAVITSAINNGDHSSASTGDAIDLDRIDLGDVGDGFDLTDLT